MSLDDNVRTRIAKSTDEDASRKLALDSDFMRYVADVRNQQAQSTELIDNSDIKRYMQDDGTISTMLHRYNPKYQPDHQLIRKPVLIPVKPKHVQYTGRNLEGYYLAQRRGPKTVLAGKNPLITAEKYLRNYPNYVERLKATATVGTGGHQAPPSLKNRPPTKLETAFLRRLPKSMGNTPKYDRASRVYVARDPAPRLQFQGSRQLTPIQGMINKLDSVTNNGSVRKFVSNPFVRVKSLASNVSWPTRISQYARNVAPPESIISKKTNYQNVGTRPSLVNSRFRNLAATRVNNFSERKFKPIQNEIQVYGGRMIGKSRVGGQAARSIPMVAKETIITRQPHVVSRPLPNVLDRQGLIETRDTTDSIYHAPSRIVRKLANNSVPMRGSVAMKQRVTTTPGRRNVNSTTGSRLTY